MPAIEVRPKDLFALMYTSGTTGRPKGAMRSHEGNALLALATALEFGLSRDDNGLLVMPMCHANSLYFSVTFAMLGATIVIDDRPHFDPEALLGLLARERITFTSLVPTHYIMMLALSSEVKAQHDLSRVGKLLVSSAPARQETKRAILELFPNGRLFELYGSTEAGWVTVLRPDEQIDRSSAQWAANGPVRARSGCSTTRGRRYPTARSASSTHAPPTSSAATGRTPRRPRRPSAVRGVRSATWRGATRKDSSTSSTARAT